MTGTCGHGWALFPGHLEGFPRCELGQDICAHNHGCHDNRDEGVVEVNRQQVKLLGRKDSSEVKICQGKKEKEKKEAYITVSLILNCSIQNCLASFDHVMSHDFHPPSPQDSTRLVDSRPLGVV